MSHLFQRPLCEMGAAFDFAYRPVLGDPEDGSGGPCDDRPHRVELFGASADVRSSSAEWRSFLLCPDHEGQLRAYDARWVGEGHASRFRSPTTPAGRA